MLTSSSPHHTYQVGGSLSFNAPTYVQRQADEALFQGLLRGEFCYVFNARQMGKSSLRVHTTRRLQTAGVRCGVIDITTIGTQEITPEQWYASIAGLTAKTFQLNVNLRNWWHERAHLSFVNRLSDFFETVLLPQIPEQILIFIDEIDSVLSLKFSTDDFFALIRACYNRRAEQPEYRRLTFALFGVATPADLISDATRTPFNIGQAVQLRGFQLTEATPLLPGLAKTIPEPKTALERILYWTRGQPFLTQKLCQLVMEAGNRATPLLIDRLVQTHIINNWEAQDEPEHLKTIRDRLLYSEQRTGRLLGLYQQILLQSPLDTELGNESLGIPASDSPDQTELVLTGLVEKQEGTIQIKNPIYQQVFNSDWVVKQLAFLRPYSQLINTWIGSGYQDESWLLRGQALRAALAWAQDKSLSDVDYRFLAASQELDRQEAQRTLEAKQFKEVEARLELERQRSLEQRRHLRRQRVLLGIVSVMMIVAIALGFVAYSQYQQTAISEVRAIALSSEALYASNKWFDALLQAIKGKQRLQHLSGVDTNLKTKVDSALQRVVLSIQEHNRLNGHTSAVLAVDFSPDGQQIATAAVDGSVKLWKLNGSLIKTFKAHQTVIRAVKFSPDGELLASGGDDHTIKLWKRDGTLVKTMLTNTDGIWSLDFSPDSSTLISSGAGSTVEVWSRDGRWVRVLQGQTVAIRNVAFSPDGQTIAATCSDNLIKLWNADGTLRMILKGHDAPVQAFAFSPDGNILVSGSADTTIKLWSREGTLLNTLRGHDATIWKLDFSPDGKTFASASWDKTIKLWSREGTLLTTLRGHNASVWGVAFSPDGTAIASVGADNIGILWKSQSVFQRSFQGVTGTARRAIFNPEGTAIAVAGTDQTIKLWALDGTLLRTINAHDAAVIDVDWSPDGKMIASGSEDKTVKLWQPDGTLLQMLKGHSSTVLSVAWRADSNIIAASGTDGTILLWKPDGTLLKTLKGHQAPIWDIRFSPDGQTLASGSNDKTIRLWNREGKLLKILKGHDAPVWKVTFSPDGILASGSGDMTVKLWTRDGTFLKTLGGHTAAIWGIAFSPDGSLIATASVDETVKLWKRDGTLLTTLKGHRAGVRSVMFDPNRPILASAGDDQTFILWNLEQILHLDPLTYGCDWVRDYLQTNAEVEESDRNLCNSAF